MSDEITNALTAEDVNILARGVPDCEGYHEIDWNQKEIDRADAAIVKLRALRGFTQEDVGALERDAQEWDDRSDIFAPRSAILRAIASRIAALLPPETT